MDKRKIIKGIALAAAGTGALFLTYKLLSHKDFTNDLEISYEDLSEEAVLKCIEYQQIDDMQKLQLAEELLRNNKIHELQASMLMIFQSLEQCIKKMAQNLDSSDKNKKHQGMIDLCKSLRTENIIKRHEYDTIKKFVNELRNPVFHGEKTEITIQSLKELLLFTRGFIFNYS